MQLIVAEKPSVARDIARVLGVTPRGSGCFRGAKHVVTWCVGHLVELEEPAAYDPAWKQWRLDLLPMIPERFKLRPSSGTRDQWKHVRDLLRSRDFEEVVNACDAGREGELIFRYCYELAGARLPVRRLWISSMTDAALKAGFARLQPGARYDALADAARCRSEADWLVGLNATRAVTVRSRGGDNALYSVGRVQTPTLAMVVAREKAIQAFVPRDYWEVTGSFTTEAKATFRALWSHRRHTRLATRALADAVVARAAGHPSPPTNPRVESVEKKHQREPPPLLFDLTSLQRTANKRYGLSAQRTLDVAQALYETHKLLTYPRTDARHLSTDLRAELPDIFDALAKRPAYAPFAAHLRANPPGPTPRVFNNAKVSDHHAIIPTTKAPDRATLDRDEERVYDLVVRRFLGAFYPDAEFALTAAVVVVGAAAPPPADDGKGDPREAYLDALPPPPDRFVAKGRVRLVPGWQEVAGIEGGDAERERKRGDDAEGDDEGPAQVLPPLVAGQRLAGAYAPCPKQTQPPRRYTEATLLAAMESAGRDITDEALREAMRDCGLGTPATRAATIETLLKRTYVAREKKSVVPTALGVALIDNLPVEALASPELTGEWEARLARMARGEETRAAFMRDIVAFVRAAVDRLRVAAPVTMARARGGGAAPGTTGEAVGPCPRCGGAVTEGFKFFACGGCDFKLWKTVAGKKVSAALAGVLLRARRTRELPGFRSKSGRPFSAALVLDEAGAVRLSFDGAAPSPAKPAEKPAEKPAKAPKPAKVAAPPAIEALACPRCREGSLIAGRRAWGCSRWREGCRLVVPFEVAGRALTAAQVRDLATRGATRKATWQVEGEGAVGRLRLDLASEPPAVRFERDG